MTDLVGVLEAAKAECECNTDSLTVLARRIDPYRRAGDQKEGEWVARQIERAFKPYQRVHLRGLHYAIVAQGNVRKPDRTIYRNTVSDFQWLGEALKAARWGGYIPFDRISDNRNDDPIIFRNREITGGPSGQLDGGANWDGQWLFELGDIDINRPSASLAGFHRDQPYGLTIFGEKSSLEDVLRPIAERYRADLYVGTGETSDTLAYQAAKDGVADGRPLVIFTICDFDPAGWQMPVSIGRKLQALRDLCFPGLKFKVVPLGLTDEHVREFALPSTPLKATEVRGDKWRAEFGLEQTEVDALATLQPDVLRQIVLDGIAPYYDATLEARVSAAKRRWVRRAQTVINGHVDAEAVDEIERGIEDFKVGATERIEAIKTEIEERVSEADAQLAEMVEAIELPDIPALPAAVLPESGTQACLVSSDWSWVEQTRALKARKTYGEEEP
jgi:hypothetical protein